MFNVHFVIKTFRRGIGPKFLGCVSKNWSCWNPNLKWQRWSVKLSVGDLTGIFNNPFIPFRKWKNNRTLLSVTDCGQYMKSYLKRNKKKSRKENYYTSFEFCLYFHKRIPQIFLVLLWLMPLRENILSFKTTSNDCW